MIKDGAWYRCAQCGQTLGIAADVAPRFSIRGTGGQPNERVLSVDGKEIHRCTSISRTDLAAR